MSTTDPGLLLGLILCLETAIEGGSIAIFQNGQRVGGIVGSNEISRAEGLLPSIDKLIADSGYRRSQLDAVVVSTGPGSFTSIRIGLATAMGLSAALDIPCIGITAFEALANSAGYDTVTVAIPMGRDLVAIQSFRSSISVKEPELISSLTFHEMIDRSAVGNLLAHHSLAQGLRAHESGIVDVGSDIASMLYSAARRNGRVGELHPLFLDRRQFTKI